MRCALILTLFAASLAHATWNGYVEVRDLDLDADGVETLRIESGAGKLSVAGVSGAEAIRVTATIAVPDAGDDKARRIIESDLVLSLEREGDRAVLSSRFDGTWWRFHGSPRVDLEVRMPERLALSIDDGSGSVTVRGTRGAIDLTDGSGSMTLVDVGEVVRIDDGSGSIDVRGVDGDLSIDDGSGSISVVDVVGSVTIDDGSGSIDVDGVGGDLVIEDDGSGSLRHSRIAGVVEDRS